MKKVPIIRVRPIRGVFDSDWDGVPNDRDCQWWNPHKQDRSKGANTRIRNPVKYLVEKHGVPIRYAKKFLAQPAFIHKYWKEDSSGLYIDKEMLNSIGYGWNKERKMLMETLESTEKVREASRKAMKKDYGKILSKKEMEEKIKEMPKKYQKDLRRTQRIMKKIS